MCPVEPCQVPRERRLVSSGVKPTDAPVVGSLEMLDHSLQALRSMPVNLSLNSSAATDRMEYGAACLAGDSRGGDGKDGGRVSLIKMEGQMSMGVSCSGGAYPEDPREHIRMVYEQSNYDLPLAGFLKNEQRSTPDSTNEDSVEREVRANKLILLLH